MYGNHRPRGVDIPDNANVNRRPRRSFAPAIFLIVAIAPMAARGGISAPRSSAVFSADGSKVLVMRSPFPGGDTRPSITFPDGRIVDVHSTFPQSGVYYVMGFKPVWQATLFALDWDYICSDDLEHVVVMNRFARKSGAAITFYNRGIPVASYDCKSLLHSFTGERFLPYSTWDWHYMWYDRLRLASDHQSVELSTARRHLWLGFFDLDLGVQEFYTFDITTGSMRRQHSTLVRALVIGLAEVLSILSVLVVSLWFTVRWTRRRLRTRSGLRGFDVAVGELEVLAANLPPVSNPLTARSASPVPRR
jgi:hypothetical protein